MKSDVQRISDSIAILMQSIYGFYKKYFLKIYIVPYILMTLTNSTKSWNTGNEKWN